MGNYVKQLCNYLVVRDLVGRNHNESHWCKWCVFLLWAIVILGLIYVCTLIIDGNCRDWYFLINIPLFILCSTYIVSILIKRMPDSNREDERNCRMARFFLQEMNRCQNHQNERMDDTSKRTETDEFKKMQEETDTLIKNALDSISLLIKKLVEVLQYIATKNERNSHQS